MDISFHSKNFDVLRDTSCASANSAVVKPSPIATANKKKVRAIDLDISSSVKSTRVSYANNETIN